MGRDWRDRELYGYEEGYMIDGEFIPEDDVTDYLEENYGLQRSEDVEEYI